MQAPRARPDFRPNAVKTGLASLPSPASEAGEPYNANPAAPPEESAPGTARRRFAPPRLPALPRNARCGYAISGTGSPETFSLRPAQGERAGDVLRGDPLPGLNAPQGLGPRIRARWWPLVLRSARTTARRIGPGWSAARSRWSNWTVTLTLTTHEFSWTYEIVPKKFGGSRLVSS